MKLTSLLLLPLLASCAAGIPPSPDSSPWIPLYGSYAFAGIVLGQNRTAVQGSVRLDKGRYYLSGTQGACDARLPQEPSNILRLACSNITVSLRRSGNEFQREGWATITVTEMVERTKCHTGPHGEQVCTTQREPTDVRRRGRIEIRPVDDGG
jgi:hypothetical protein